MAWMRERTGACSRMPPAPLDRTRGPGRVPAFWEAGGASLAVGPTGLRASMTGTGTRGASLSAVGDLFARGDDPYAGADPTTSRTAVAVLSLLHGALILGFLPLFPPTEGVGPVAGWILAGAVVLADVVAGVALLRERRDVRFNVLLALTYAGIGEILLIQALSQSVLPYQLFLLIWVGAAAVQPARRAGAVLVGILLATLAPLALEEGTTEERDIVGRALLFASVGLVLIVYVNYVRAQRLGLQKQERYARKEADAATKRVRDLQWITDATLAHRALDELLDELLERITRVFEADHGAILLSVGDGRRLEVGASRGASSQPGNETAIAPEQEFASRVAAERRPVALEREGGGGSSTPAAGPRSLLGVPLLVSARTIGVLYVGTRAPRHFTEADTALLELVGDRVALAVDGARLFERERHIAETLQRSLLPELPRIPGTKVAARYQPAGGGTEVGGDWYDVLELDDGRIALAMGDVVGRGVRAAALMGKLRTALEAYALDGHSPVSVIQRLHSLMERQHRSEIATLFCVILDPDDGSAEFANAGHLPVLVRGPDGKASFLGAATSPPLGALPYSRFAQDSAQIAFDSTLLLFTDGLVEQPGVSIELRLEELRAHRGGGPRRPGSAVRGGDGPDAGRLGAGRRRGTACVHALEAAQAGLHARVPGGARGAGVDPDRSRAVAEADDGRPGGRLCDQGGVRGGLRQCDRARLSARGCGLSAGGHARSGRCADRHPRPRNVAGAAGGGSGPRARAHGRAHGLDRAEPFGERHHGAAPASPLAQGSPVRQLATLKLDQVRGVTVASIAGEIDLSDAGELQATISDAVPNHAAGLVVELSEVTYLDSAGVALLFDLARRVARRQQMLGIVVPREAPVREILHLSGAADALTLHDELEEALERIRTTAGDS